MAPVMWSMSLLININQAGLERLKMGHPQSCLYLSKRLQDLQVLCQCQTKFQIPHCCGLREIM